MSGSEQELRNRILGAVAREPSLTRRQRRARNAALFAAAAGTALAIFFLVGGVRPYARPLPLMVGTFTGSAALAAAGLALAAGRAARSMLGRRPALLMGAMAVLPLLFLGWKVGVSALYPGTGAAWPGRPGLRCLILALLAGLAPLGAALAAHHRTHPVRPAVAGAALGAACGLAAAVLVDLWCPVAHVPHLLLGHLLPVAVLALAGALAGAQLLTPRFRAR